MECSGCNEKDLIIKNLRRELGILNQVNHRKNLELDSLHFVWCDGGCGGGVHRWDKSEITEEIVYEAIRNTNRLKRWYLNILTRQLTAAQHNRHQGLTWEGGER